MILFRKGRGDQHPLAMGQDPLSAGHEAQLDPERARRDRRHVEPDVENELAASFIARFRDRGARRLPDDRLVVQSDLDLVDRLRRDAEAADGLDPPQGSEDAPPAALQTGAESPDMHRIQMGPAQLGPGRRKELGREPVPVQLPRVARVFMRGNVVGDDQTFQLSGGLGPARVELERAPVGGFGRVEPPGDLVEMAQLEGQIRVIGHALEGAQVVVLGADEIASLLEHVRTLDPDPGALRREFQRLLIEDGRGVIVLSVPLRARPRDQRGGDLSPRPAPRDPRERRDRKGLAKQAFGEQRRHGDRPSCTTIGLGLRHRQLQGRRRRFSASSKVEPPVQRGHVQLRLRSCPEAA